MPTVGLNLTTIVKPSASFIFWDVGGQLTLRKLWTKYYPDCNGIIFVIDGADDIRFSEVRETLQTIFGTDEGNDYLAKIPIMFLLNKNDKKEVIIHPYILIISKIK